MAPNYKCSGSNPPALVPIRYTPHFPFPRRPSTLPSPENSSARLTQLPPPPSQPTQESTRFPHFLASAFLLAGHPATPTPRKVLSAVARPEKYLVPLEGKTPAAPAPTLSRPYPGTQATRSAVPPGCSPRSDSCLARPGEEAPSWPHRPLHPPDWAGRRPHHTSPRALAQPNTGSGAAFPDPPLVSQAQRETKGRAPGPTWLGRPWPALRGDPNKARAAASRPRPGLPIGPRTLLAGGVILPQVQPVPLGHLRTLQARGFEGRRKRSWRLYWYSRGQLLNSGGPPPLPLQQPTPCGQNQELKWRRRRGLGLRARFRSVLCVLCVHACVVRAHAS